MRKIILILLSLVVSLNLMAINYGGLFGFAKLASDADYQQYVGQDFCVRPAYGDIVGETWDETGFTPTEDDFHKVFTITKITSKSVVLNNKANTEYRIEAVEKGSKNKIKFKTYKEFSFSRSAWSGKTKTWPHIDMMPIVFVKPFTEFKNKMLREIVSIPIVKDKYQVEDVYFAEGLGRGKNDDGTYTTVKIPAIFLKAKNTRTGEIKNVQGDFAKSLLFKDALEGSYTASLIKVEKPEDSSDRYGKVESIDENGVNKFSFQDENISISIFATDRFDFDLKNVSDHSIKLIWNDAAYVDLRGNSSKIMHNGIKYSQREENQQSTTIIAGANIHDVIIPNSSVYYDKGLGENTKFSGWRIAPLFPTNYRGKNNIGEVRLMLPIQIKGVTNEYTFVFKVYYKFKHPELLTEEGLQ